MKKKRLLGPAISLSHKVYPALESGCNEQITDQRFTQMKAHLNADGTETTKDQSQFLI